VPLNFNQAQLKAIYANDPKVVVIAPPGSGKTAVLCGALKEYSCLHPSHSITAITYTKKAALELSQKIGNPRVRTSTIHAWSWHQLDKLGAKYGFVVEIMPEEEMRRIMQKIASMKGLKFVNIYQLYNYIVGNIKTLELDDNIVKKYEKIKAHYIQYKQENELYDFTDLPQYLLNVLEEYDEEIYDIDAFYVDEFQDVDNIQFEIFKRVNASKKFFIGDFRQSIYGFNGALEDVFARLTEEGFHTYHLEINYRSKQSIIDVADSFRDSYDGNRCFISDLRGLVHSDIICDRGPGGKVYIVDKDGYCLTAGDAECEDAKTIVRYLLSMPDTMILCRANKQVRKIQALGADNCSTVHQAKGLEYENVILVDMEVENEEELNIAYVGMTRAKNELCVINYELLVSILSTITIEPPKQTKNMLF
jgi:superfamily I DNA/RNA helicase